jgi:hypothetical protein
MCVSNSLFSESIATPLSLLAVVQDYDRCFGLGLGDGEKTDLVEFLKSLPGQQEGRSKYQ